MTLASPTEQLVEDVAAVHFDAIGAIVKRGVEIDVRVNAAVLPRCC